eukprot:34677-Eustigmatos_ZCMA.PRE.1
MSGADLPDLTLIDLPGIVRTRTAGQSEGVIRDVNTLIQDYLDQVASFAPHCLHPPEGYVASMSNMHRIMSC